MFWISKATDLIYCFFLVFWTVGKLKNRQRSLTEQPENLIPRDRGLGPDLSVEKGKFNWDKEMTFTARLQLSSDVAP